MVRVFALKLEPQYSIESLKRWIIRMPAEYQDRCNRKADAVDVARVVFGHALSVFAVASVSGTAASEVCFSRDYYGKPFLKSPIGLHFNCSHSGDWVVCAVGNLQTGVDVEKVRMLPEKLIRGFFTAREIADVQRRFGADIASGFCDQWTLKECYIKAMGKGFPESLLTVEILNDGGEWMLWHPGYIERFHFKQYVIDSSHRLSVCSRDWDFDKECSMVTQETLLPF